MRVIGNEKVNNSDAHGDQAQKVPDIFAPVAEEESGQKLLQFLSRRLNFPPSLLHRWIRTGQIRINGKRCKPFARLETGDKIRIPPFIAHMEPENIPSNTIPAASNLKFIAQYGDLAALNKPRGLPVQPGSGHEDCVSRRLQADFNTSLFKPVPCHRLDRDTSGVLLVAMSFTALKETQENLRQGLLHKEYLAWVHGNWPWDKDVLLRHFLRKENSQGKALMRVSNDMLPYSREAVCAVRKINADREKSLLQIRLLTGRTHQIRAQLSFAGFPVIGDGKYGKDFQTLFLHSFRHILPQGYEFLCAPDWSNSYMVPEIPPFAGTQKHLLALPSLPR